ncbi:SoxR reducing system RseC family protein [Desulfatitalea alkaliphila]|uniref:SoxR reducing system RseC family protein n=1 Tax=Desulfatitalea alkaliphila TaxID=2929485 RepID=A0AA41R1E2_9BACT|nr:SoxR reducing system RseC family protein [Desulfatitalea alkaliphila]MCJ8499911.1 SoxR reducing system RseC family protein [Desulfatitalea alkaliphila]
MAIEQGIVIRQGDRPTTVWVQTVRSSACESCASRDSCRTAETGENQEVEVFNTAGARVGDRIQLMIRTGSLLKATFLLYIFPILGMLGGAVVAQTITDGLRLCNSSVAAAIGALAGLVAALAYVRIRGQRLGNESAYRPHIVRILGRAPLDAHDASPTVHCQIGNAGPSHGK